MNSTRMGHVRWVQWTKPSVVIDAAAIAVAVWWKSHWQARSFRWRNPWNRVIPIDGSRTDFIIVSFEPNAFWSLFEFSDAGISYVPTMTAAVATNIVRMLSIAHFHRCDDNFVELLLNNNQPMKCFANSIDSAYVVSMCDVPRRDSIFTYRLRSDFGISLNRVYCFGHIEYMDQQTRVRPQFFSNRKRKIKMIQCDDNDDDGSGSGGDRSKAHTTFNGMTSTTNRISADWNLSSDLITSIWMLHTIQSIKLCLLWLF